MTFSSILLPAVLGVAARLLFGHQRWYWGVLFFVIIYPASVAILTGAYLNLGGSGSGIVRLAGQNALWGTLAGALLLSGRLPEEPSDT